MISAPARPIRRSSATVHHRADAGHREVDVNVAVARDPADLAATLRDLAARAHRAVRARNHDNDEVISAENLHELADLLPKIVELQHSVDMNSQHDLAVYLAALRREIESRMG